MDKTLAVILMIVALIVGGLAGAVVFPKTVVQEKEVIIEVPVEVEVPVSYTADAVMQIAIDDVLDKMDDNDQLRCGGDDYNLAEVSVVKLYDGHSVVFVDDDEYIVKGEIKLNFKQDDVKRCRRNVEFKVLYEEGEDPVFKLIN